MSDKKLGSNVTYLDPEDTSYDTVVFREDKPLSHSELTLLQDLQAEERAEVLKGLMPSGFLSGDLDGQAYNDFNFTNSADQFELNGMPMVHVNGWVLPLTYTNTTTSGKNVIELDAPSSSSDDDITADFVYLEVWEALIEPDPSDTNKPASDKIYPNGNVLAPSGTWLDDDLKDNPVASNNNIETTRRVQIQYAIRTQRLADSGSGRVSRVGYPDSAVKAQGPNSSQTTEDFSVSSRDPGLWVAGGEIGSGNEISGTVDGFVYSIPIALVYRRNSAGFDFQSNGNGAVLGVGTNTDSDRPDGLYADQVVLDDVQDLRHSTSAKNPDWESVLETNTSLLLDNELRSWAFNTTSTGSNWQVGGDETAGTRHLKADVVTIEDPYGGGEGNKIREPDGVCSVFSDRSHSERHVIEYSKASNWAKGDTLSFPPPASSDNPIDMSNAPANAAVTDINSVKLNDGAMPDFPVDDVSGLDSKSTTITLGEPPLASSEDIWVEYEVTYPTGGGLTSTFAEDATNFHVTVARPSNFDSQFSTSFTNDASGREDFRQYADLEYENGPHREAKLMYHLDHQRTITTKVFNEGGNPYVLVPELPYLSDPNNPGNDITVTISGTSRTINSVTRRKIEIDDSGGSISDGTDATVDFVPHRPFPDESNFSSYTSGSESRTVMYYRTPAIQSIPREYLDTGNNNNALDIEPLFVPNYLYAGVASSGSMGTSYPYEAPLDQIPVSANTAGSYEGEASLNAPGPVSIDDFDGEVGLLRLPTFVPMVPVDTFTLQDPEDTSDGDDEEFHDHYLNVNVGSYRPSAFSQPMSSPVEHKVFMPIVGRLTQNTEFASKGTVVLVIFSQYYVCSSLMPDGVGVEENRISLNNDMTCAAIYKIKGNFLDR